MYQKVTMLHAQSPSVTFKRSSIRELSIDGGDGSEDITLKMNSRFFTLCLVYSSSLKMSNGGPP